MQNQIENAFKYHPADKKTQLKHEVVREICKNAAIKLDMLLPNSREKSLAITSLEEAMMWANACIARVKSIKEE